MAVMVAITRARLTGDSNPATNIDAGLDGDQFYLATGGDTKNERTRLRGTIVLPAKVAIKEEREPTPPLKSLDQDSSTDQ